MQHKKLKMNQLNNIKALHTDAVTWKATMLWKTATNPDAAVVATTKIVSMLTCISNVMKRDAYATRISDVINEGVKSINDEIKDVESEIKTLTKQYDKLKNKKHQDADEEAECNNIRNEIASLNGRKSTLLTQLLPKLSTSDLKSYLKEEIERKEAELKKKTKAEDRTKAALLNEDLGLPIDFDGDTSDVFHFGVYAYKGKYYSKNTKGFYDEISNFTMKILFHTNTGTDAAYRLIVIKNVYGIEKTVNINTDEFVSVGTFKKVLARQGDFIFKGNDSDLSRLSEMLQQHERPTSLVDILGYNHRGQFYAWANGVIDMKDNQDGAEFHEVDDYGIVALRDRNYFIPALSKMYLDKDYLYQNEKRFFFTKDSKTSFNEWSDLHYKAYGPASIIGQCWIVSTLFRDFIFSQNNIRATPILNLNGQRGSGKGVFANSLLSLFGAPQPPIGLGSVSTPKGYQRKFAQYKNAVVWLDEYKNNINKTFVESLKQIYDGIGYTRAKMTNDFQTDDMPVNSSCLLSGQEMPTIEPALFSRVILIQFKPGKDRPEDVKIAFNRLKSMETNGISNITSEILSHRDAFVKKFPKAFSGKLKQFYQDIKNNDIDDRFIMNIAILSATFECLCDSLNFSFCQMDVDVVLIENLKNQFGIMQGNDDIGKFWQLVENLASQQLIVPGRHYKLHSKDNNLLCIKIQDIYPLYLKELRARGDNNVLSKPTLDYYLQCDTETYVGDKKARFGGQSLNAKGFKYAELKKRYHIELFGYGTDSNQSDEEEELF